jgi:hypothetical protein
MANERSETDPLFRKLTDPAEIYKTAFEGCGFFSEPLVAWGVELNALEARMWQPEQFPDNDNVAWIYREAARMWRLWEQLPDSRIFELATCLYGYGDRLQFWKWCLAPSYSEPGKIRYTPSAEYGKADRQIVTTLGKFLTKHYSDRLSTQDIKAWADHWAGISKPVELQFANTPDEVEHVYTNGPDSCMSGDDWSGEHPARIWGYCKHTRVAYITNDSEEIIGRCLVREDCDPKVYIRIYPEDNHRMKAALERAGYVRDRCGLRDLRVPAIPHRRRGFLMPYVDGIELASYDGGKYITLDDCGSLDVHSTSGYCEDREEERCPRCSTPCSEDELHFSDYHEEHFCDSCSDDFVYARTANGEDSIRLDETVRVGNHYYLNDDDTRERYGLVELSDGEVVKSDDAVCLENDDWVNTNDAMPTPWDSHIHSDEACEDDFGNYCLEEDLHLLEQADGAIKLAAYRSSQDNDADFEEAYEAGLLLTVEQWILKNEALGIEGMQARMGDDFARGLVARGLTALKAKRERNGQYQLAA